MPQSNEALTSISSKGRGSERGAVAILVALLLTVLMIFGVLAIDVSQYTSSREQAQYYSRLAVLGALERFYSSTSATTPLKINDALARAKEVSNLNLMISDLGHPRPEDFTNIEKDADDVDQSKKAVLTPGNWYYEDPGTPSNPCAGNYPCFRKLSTIADDTKITAFRVTGALYQGVTTRLARAILGIESMPVAVFATAAVTPRHGCFVVDLTGSITGETHKVESYTSQDTDPLKYGRAVTASYVLNADNSGLGESTIVDDYWSHLATTIPDRPANETAWNTFLASKYPTGVPPGNIMPTVANITPEQYSSMHFASDYRKMVMLGDQDYSDLSSELRALHPNPDSSSNYEVYQGSNKRRWAHVDTYADSAGLNSGRLKYRGPEPLHTVMVGLNAAMKEFKARKVAGDRACLIFYSRRTPWPGLVKLTDNFDYLISLTDTTVPSEGLSNDASDKNPRDPATGLELLIRHGLVPGGKEANFTNTPLALTEASNQLKDGNKNGGFSSDFVVSISDGVSNCSLASGSNFATGAYDCQNLFGNNNKSFTDLKTVGENAFKSKNIPIHWIMVGNSVGPHTLKYKQTPGQDGPGKCLSDDEARVANVQMVRGGWAGATFDTTKIPWTWASGVSGDTAFQNMSSSSPYYQPNLVAYDLAAKTRGLWGPVRPRSPSCGANRKDEEDLCTYDVGDPNALTNDDAIQKYDPYCRTPEEQMTDYMDKIIGDNPFSLVEGQ